MVEATDDGLVHHEVLQGPMPPVPQGSPMPLSRALRGVASTLAGPQTYQGPPGFGHRRRAATSVHATGIHPPPSPPSAAPGGPRGPDPGAREQPGDFTAPDLPLMEDIARRAGLALDNARLYQRQRKVAETMQRHCCPRCRACPAADGGPATAAPDASQVGGDWYDAFSLSDGATALAIGDVVGHDLEAAAGMAQVRNMLRAYAWALQSRPAGSSNAWTRRFCTSPTSPWPP